MGNDQYQKIISTLGDVENELLKRKINQGVSDNESDYNDDDSLDDSIDDESMDDYSLDDSSSD